MSESRDGKHWTPAEDALLIAAVAAELPNKRIARQLNRSTDGVQSRIYWLRQRKRIPPATTSRRHGAVTRGAGDVWASADMAHALNVIGRLLPEGMRVLIYRPEGETRAAIEATHSTGDMTTHWADGAMH